MVSLAVALLAIVLAYFAGVVAFGKRAQAVKHQRAGSYAEHAVSRPSAADPAELIVGCQDRQLGLSA